MQALANTPTGMTIDVQRTTKQRSRPEDQSLGFGQLFTDHLFCMEYETKKGWHNARIVPYGPLSLDPAALALHYGQSVFEGMKAFKQDNQTIAIFRAEKHAERLKTAMQRLCIPAIDQETFLSSVIALIQEDSHWVPTSPGTALYIRPTVLAIEPTLSVRASAKYLFYIVLSPVGSYYGGTEMKPVRIWVEDEFTRAAMGGLGSIKTGANYACSLMATERARSNGFAQVLWLDAKEKRFVEEVGTMNLFVQIGGTVITPPLDGGTILPGITRASALELLRKWDVPVQERRLELSELVQAHQQGQLHEVFGTGTAAVVTPVSELVGNSINLKVNEGRIGPIAERLYRAITEIQSGKAPDSDQWMQWTVPSSIQRHNSF